MRNWKTEVISRGGKDLRELSTSYKTYSLLQIRGLVNQHRVREKAEGKPQRKLAPISSWVLDELLFQFFKDKFRKGDVLEKITIEDNKHYGV